MIDYLLKRKRIKNIALLRVRRLNNQDYQKRVLELEAREEITDAEHCVRKVYQHITENQDYSTVQVFDRACETLRVPKNELSRELVMNIWLSIGGQEEIAKQLVEMRRETTRSTETLKN
jgi:hypothetical protein